MALSQGTAANPVNQGPFEYIVKYFGPHHHPPPQGGGGGANWSFSSGSPGQYVAGELFFLPIVGAPGDRWVDGSNIAQTIFGSLPVTNGDVTVDGSGGGFLGTGRFTAEVTANIIVSDIIPPAESSPIPIPAVASIEIGIFSVTQYRLSDVLSPSGMLQVFSPIALSGPLEFASIVFGGAGPIGALSASFSGPAISYGLPTYRTGTTGAHLAIGFINQQLSGHMSFLGRGSFSITHTP